MRTAAFVLGWAVAVAGVMVASPGCSPSRPATPEPTCTAENKAVECWWVLYGCYPEISPRDACLSLCRDQERGQLKICEGRLPHRPQPVMLSVRNLRCDRCLRFSDQPFMKPGSKR
jgi:hypothetical protein